MSRVPQLLTTIPPDLWPPVSTPKDLAITRDPAIMKGRGIKPIYSFDDIGEFNLRHRGGTENEFDNESKDIAHFNETGVQFRAWVICSLGESRKKTHWLFLVAPGDKVEWRLPKEGESCKLMLLSNSGKTEKSGWLEAQRIDNPAASLGLAEEEWQRYAALRVTAPSKLPEDFIRPILDNVDATLPLTTTRRWDNKAIKIKFHLNVSKATKDAELRALNKLFYNNDEGNKHTFRQRAAFEYLMNFKNPAFSVNLFHHFPQLKDPLNNPYGLPVKVIESLIGFNEHQWMAYKHLLGNLPCGICIIPGGPGAGKTHWNLILTCAIQSKNLVVDAPDEIRNKSAKVLYLLDINKPLDDTANKMVRLYKELGLKKKAIRLYGWHYGSLNNSPNFTGKFITISRINRFGQVSRENPACLAPTLDEAAWQHFNKYKRGKYRDLARHVDNDFNRGRTNELRDMIDDLYYDVIDTIDFIATTPVPAATGFHGIFKPDLVIFDESPHARELSTLIAIANYEPLAWIFSGDHRQTRPFVASDDVRDNPYAPQMLVSTMERAYRAGAIKCSLLINHRAHAGLQRLASNLFYNKAMISGHQENQLFPPTVRYIQKYLEKFMEGRTCQETRLIVCTDNSKEKQAGTSWYNDGHLEWVMERVKELLLDPKFKRVGTSEPGTILIIAPYKEAFHRYKHAIKSLYPQIQQPWGQVDLRLEARTIDTVQGNEADFVFLDLVRHHGTEFTDDPNRLCVALTRARQGEIIMMNPGMCTKGSAYQPTTNLSRIWNHLGRLGQIVRIRKGGPQGSLLGNGVRQWEPMPAQVPRGVLDDDASKPPMVSKTTLVNKTAVASKTTLASETTTNIISQVRTVVDIPPQTATAPQENGVSQPREIFQHKKEMTMEEPASQPAPQKIAKKDFWQQCLDDFLGVQSSPEQEPAQVDSPGEGKWWDVWARMGPSSGLNGTKPDNMDRGSVSAVTETKLAEAQTKKLTAADRDALPSGSDWW